MKIQTRIRIPLAVAAALLLSARVASAQACQANCYLVNTAADTINPSCGVSGIGTCSLRDALTKIALSSNNVIHFAIGTGPQTITLLSDLPDIHLPVTIDGTTQPGFAGVPLIQVRRGDAGLAMHGLRTRGPSTNTLTLKSLVLSHFNGSACLVCAGVILSDPGDLVRPGGHTIQGCYIGTDATGTMADGNLYGIQDNSEGGNTFGGTSAADRNVISGNLTTGISIGTLLAGYSVQSVVQGNYIGLDATGSVLIPNFYGIMIGAPFPGFSPGILVGGSAPGAGNVIAGNGEGVQINEGIADVIQGNTFGLDATGLNTFIGGGGNALEIGVFLYGETNATITSNVIVASSAGIELNAEPVTNIPTHGTIVHGNYLGTDITGNRGLPSSGAGILIGNGAPDNVIGGSGAGQGNVIGNFTDGIRITGGPFGGPSVGNVIHGNKIGLGTLGSPIPNATGVGAYSAEGNTVIGGINPGEGNVIAFNTQSGIDLQSGSGNIIRGNSIHGNGALGIDDVFPFSTLPVPNDVGDGDTGPNGLQNFPILAPVTFPDSGHVRIMGSLNSHAVTHYTLDFYANSLPLHPKDFLQGQTWIGLFDNPAVTDAQGNLSFDVTLPVSGAPIVWISATATDDAGDTSEFSQRSLFSVSPTHGPAIADRAQDPQTANPVTLTGQLFQPGATVKFGGLLAGNVVVSNATTITATTPTLPPGSLVDVLVTNPDASTALMQNAWVSDFLDVPQDGFYPYITSLVSNGTTAGCGGGDYCPSRSITRAEMAVFLLKAKYGLWPVPPPCTPPPNQVFADVPCPATPGFPFSDWIQELSSSGITAGCDPIDYCPDRPVTRDQMAVFLLKAEHGASYPPPPCVGLFTDVPCPPTPAFPFSDWIEQLSNEQITAGCVLGPPALYCPTREVRRDEMAVFITKTFKLP